MLFFFAQQKRVRATPRLSHYSLFMFATLNTFGTGLKWTERSWMCCTIVLHTNNNNDSSATFNFSQFGFHFIYSFASHQIKKTVWVWALDRCFTWSAILHWHFRGESVLYTIYLPQIDMLSLVIHGPHLKYCEYCVAMFARIEYMSWLLYKFS